MPAMPCRQGLNSPEKFLVFWFFSKKETAVVHFMLYQLKIVSSCHGRKKTRFNNSAVE
jgi:hypothetical protein